MRLRPEADPRVAGAVRDDLADLLVVERTAVADDDHLAASGVAMQPVAPNATMATTTRTAPRRRMVLVLTRAPEPASVTHVSAARLQGLLGLSDDELLAILGSDPIAVITGEEDTRPEIRILLQLLEENPPPRAWLRAGAPSPLQRLVQQDFAGFEDALAEFNERGFVIRPRGRDASRPATSP
jgi:hypothetical protein